MECKMLMVFTSFYVFKSIISADFVLFGDSNVAQGLYDS